MSKHAEAPPPYSQPPPAGFHAPPPQHPHMAPPGTTTFVMAAPQVGPDQQTMSCPSCHASIRTSVKHEPSTKTHVIALILCLIGCWCCCCIPYCMDSCQNTNHYCPSCGAFIGSYQS